MTSHRVPIYMEAPESAKTITVYVNGDQNFGGKKFIVNRRRTPTFDTLLGDVTSGVNAPFGAVRNLYTPVGGTRVVDLAELLSGKTYVASGGARTKFQKIEYGAKPRPRRARSQDPRRTRDEKTLNPVVAQSRFKDFVDTNQKNISVYANGVSRTSYRFLLKSPRSQNLDLILDDVASKISAKTGAAIRSLYTVQGKKILSATQIEDQGTYVAAGSEKFKPIAYGTSTAPPSVDRGRHARPMLKPIRVVSKDRKPKKKDDNKMSSKPTKVNRPLPPIDKKQDSMEVDDDENTKVDLPIEQQVDVEVEEAVVEMQPVEQKTENVDEEDQVVSEETPAKTVDQVVDESNKELEKELEESTQNNDNDTSVVDNIPDSNDEIENKGNETDKAEIVPDTPSEEPITTDETTSPNEKTDIDEKAQVEALDALENAQDEIKTENDVKDALQAGVEALNKSDHESDVNDDADQVDNVDQVESVAEGDVDADDADDVKAAIVSGVTALNQSEVASETSEPVQPDQSTEDVKESEVDSDVKDAIQHGVEALNGVDGEENNDDNDTTEVTSAIKSGVEALNESAPADGTPIEMEPKEETDETIEVDSEVKEAIQEGVEALNNTTSDSDVAEDTVIVNETLTEDTTLVADDENNEPAVDDVKDAISAGVEALNASKPASDQEEPKADILVIETPDVVEVDDNETEDDVQTPETLVNETITPLASSAPVINDDDESKSVDQARQRSPTPQIESDEDEQNEEEEVVEPSHVETVVDKKETPVDKPVVVDNKETIDEKETDGISDAYVSARAAAKEEEEKATGSPSGN